MVRDKMKHSRKYRTVFVVWCLFVDTKSFILPLINVIKISVSLLFGLYTFAGLYGIAVPLTLESTGWAKLSDTTLGAYIFLVTSECIHKFYDFWHI